MKQRRPAQDLQLSREIMFIEWFSHNFYISKGKWKKKKKKKNLQDAFCRIKELVRSEYDIDDDWKSKSWEYTAIKQRKVESTIN